MTHIYSRYIDLESPLATDPNRNYSTSSQNVMTRAGITAPSEASRLVEAFSQAITSNLLGGIGHFYGTSIVDPSFSNQLDDDGSSADQGTDDKQSTSKDLTEPKALLTGTPSRSFFLRGFYWDEGFHLLHVGE
jgi:mannosyl-oligosaccharide glucosidase